MNIEEHGGGCCGIYHVYNFILGAGWTEEFKKKQLDQSIDAVVEGYFDDHFDEDEDGDYATALAKHMSSWRTLVEVVLVDGQLPEWEKIVTDKGFKEVTEFKNSNSGNVCHVFHYVTNQ